MPSNDEIAKEFWNREVVEHTHVTWMGDPLIRTYINESLSGSPHGWPLNWFVEWLQGRTFRRALSVGCGSGGLERDLLTRGICEEIDAFDGSAESIRIANQEAERAGMADRIHYSIGDFNEPQLPPNTYDAVFAHHSMHHVAKLEKLYRALLRAMKPDALFYMDEFIGPSRHEWTEENFAPQRAIYDALPASVRTVERLPMPIQPFDPSEAIRSAEIVPELKVGFDILEKRNYGGNVLSVMYAFTDGSVTAELIEAEREMLRGGAEPYHAVIVARPKRGIAKRVARARYFIVPKVKRLLRELKVSS
jgi:SAM-dependent methyltransferase